eukprot:12990503-Alexandrium_andersonii.AAC.1
MCIRDRTCTKRTISIGPAAEGCNRSPDGFYPGHRATQSVAFTTMRLHWPLSVGGDELGRSNLLTAANADELGSRARRRPGPREARGIDQ